MKTLKSFLKESFIINETDNITVSELSELLKKTVAAGGTELKSYGVLKNGEYFIIWQTGLNGYRSAVFKLKNDTLERTLKAKSHNSLEEAKKYGEKYESITSWIDADSVVKDKEYQANYEAEKQEKQQNASVENKQVLGEPVETIATWLAEVLGGQVKGYYNNSIQGIVVNLTTKMQLIEFSGVKCYIYNGVFENSYSAKRYNRKKGFTIQFEDKNLKPITFIQNNRGNGFNGWWSDVTVKTIVDIINKRLNK